MEPTIKVGVDSFNNYLKANAASAESKKKSDLYYHVNVVAEAYTDGYTNGEKDGKNNFSELLFQKFTDRIFDQMNQVYITGKAVSTYFIENNFKVTKMYIDVSINKPKVIISVPEEQLLNDDFVKFAYKKIHDMKCSFSSMFQNTIDLSLIESDNLEEDLLISDGFGYSEQL